MNALLALTCAGPRVPSVDREGVDLALEAVAGALGHQQRRPSGLKITWSASGAANPNPLLGVNGVASERVEPAIGVIVPFGA